MARHLGSCSAAARSALTPRGCSTIGAVGFPRSRRRSLRTQSLDINSFCWRLAPRFVKSEKRSSYMVAQVAQVTVRHTVIASGPCKLGDPERRRPALGPLGYPTDCP